MSTQKFGKMVRERREGTNLTVSRAAELCELSDRGLTLIELGDVDPKLSSVIKIATVLGIYLGNIEGCKPQGVAEPPESVAEPPPGHRKKQ